MSTSATNAQFLTGVNYSFKLLRNTVMSSKFDNVKVAGIMDADGVPSDTLALHSAFYPHMESVADNPASYNYLKVKHPSGKVEFVGIPWIDGDTVFEVQEIIFEVRIRGKRPEDQALLSRVLAENGFDDNVIKITQ